MLNRRVSALVWHCIYENCRVNFECVAFSPPFTASTTYREGRLTPDLQHGNPMVIRESYLTYFIFNFTL